MALPPLRVVPLSNHVPPLARGPAEKPPSCLVFGTGNAATPAQSPFNKRLDIGCITRLLIPSQNRAYAFLVCRAETINTPTGRLSGPEPNFLSRGGQDKGSAHLLSPITTTQKAPGSHLGSNSVRRGLNYIPLSLTPNLITVRWVRVLVSEYWVSLRNHNFASILEKN